MRVLHILPEHESKRTANYAADVILGLQQANIDQYVVIDRQSPRLHELEKSGVKINSKILRAPLRRLWMQRLITRLQPDIAQCWNRNAARLVPDSKTPMISWLAGYDDPGRLPRCTYFVSASRDSAAQLEKHSNPGVRAQFIPAFSEFSTVPPLDRHALATPREARVLLSPASLHPDSCHEILLAALKNLPACVGWFIGEGPFRRVLERKANDMGVIDRVRFAPVRINRSALLRAADICVLTAADRPFSTLIPQAWAAGTPVIASQQISFAAPLDNNVNGLLIQAGDESGLCHAVQRIFEEKPLRGRLAAKGYATYLGKYAREAIIQQWMNLYRQIAAG